ncbi:MAG: hypothetical protein ACPGEC_05080, partial [Flavobacteriales bacterium]
GILGFGKPQLLNQLEINNDTGLPIWALMTLLFLITIIPVVLFMFLGTKLTFPQTKRRFLGWSLSLAGLWFALILVSAIVASKQALSFATTGHYSETVSLNAKDSLLVGLSPVSLYQDYIIEDQLFDELIFDNGKVYYYDDDIEIDVLSSGNSSNYMKLKKSADGEQFLEAKARAKQISYEFQNDSNALVLDPFFLVNQYDKMKNQQLSIELYLRNGLILEFDSKLKNRLNSDFANDQNLDSDELYKYQWRIGNSMLECLDCGDLNK